jgi:hypothetical protein
MYAVTTSNETDIPVDGGQTLRLNQHRRLYSWFNACQSSMLPIGSECKAKHFCHQILQRYENSQVIF